MNDRFQELRDRKQRHDTDVKTLMAFIARLHPMSDSYNIYYRELEEAVRKALENSYTADRMSNDSWK